MHASKQKSAIVTSAVARHIACLVAGVQRSWPAEFQHPAGCLLQEQMPNDDIGNCDPGIVTWYRLSLVGSLCPSHWVVFAPGVVGFVQ